MRRGRGYQPLSYTGMAGSTNYADSLRNVHNRNAQGSRFNPFGTPTLSNPLAWPGAVNRLITPNNTPYAVPNFQPVNPVNPLNPMAGQASPTDNDYQTVSNVKNPTLQAAINQSLSSITGLNTDPTRNTTTVHRNVRNPAIEQRVQDMLSRYDVDVSNNTQSVADFASSILGSQADQRRRADEEIGSLDQIYNGQFEEDLKRINDARRIAMRAGTNTAIGRVNRQNNSARIVGGDSSYLDAIRAGKVGSIMEDEAIRQAEMDRANLIAVRDMKNKQVGTRNRVLDDVLRRPLDIIDVRQRTAGNDIANFGNVANIDSSNSLYTTDSPEALLARRMELLRGTGALDQANMFYGLRSLRDPDFSGLILSGANNFGGRNLRSPAYDGGYDDFSQFGPQRRPPTPPMRGPPRFTGYPGAQYYSDAGDGSYNLSNNFTGYGNPNSPLFYQDYPGADQINRMQDYYENGTGYVGGDMPSPMIDYGGGDDFSLDDYADYYNYQDW